MECRRQRGFSALSLLLLLVLLGGAVVVGGILGAQFFRTESTRSSQVMLEELRNLSELALVEQNFSDVVTYREVKKIPGTDIDCPGTETVAVVRYRGQVKAGIDLSLLAPGDLHVDFAGRSVTLRLPRAQVLESNLDIRSLEVVFQEEGLFVDLQAQDLVRQVRDSFEEAVGKIEGGEMVDAAEVRGRKMVEGVLRLMGFREIHIDTKE